MCSDHYHYELWYFGYGLIWQRLQSHLERTVNILKVMDERVKVKAGSTPFILYKALWESKMKLHWDVILRRPQ